MLMTGLIFILIGITFSFVSFLFWAAFTFMWRRQHHQLPIAPASLRIAVPGRIAMAATAIFLGFLSVFIGMGFCMLSLGSLGYIIFPMIALLCYLFARIMRQTYAKAVEPDVLTVDGDGIRLAGSADVHLAWHQILDMEFLNLSFRGHAFPVIGLVLHTLPPDLPPDLRIENIRYLITQPGKHNAALYLKAFAMHPSRLYAAISSHRPSQPIAPLADLPA